MQILWGQHGGWVGKAVAKDAGIPYGRQFESQLLLSPATHVQDSEAAPGSWSGPALVTAVIWGVSQQAEGLHVCVSLILIK